MKNTDIINAIILEVKKQNIVIFYNEFRQHQNHYIIGFFKNAHNNNTNCFKAILRKRFLINSNIDFKNFY